VDLYDSGATHHMSPYWDDFVQFTETLPRPLNATNQQEFQALGVGDQVIPVPNSPSPDSLIQL
ncbi:hypothetical protein C8Q74DRAFT_1182927, partial [Fomes fomentarius]